MHGTAKFLSQKDPEIIWLDLVSKTADTLRKSYTIMNKIATLSYIIRVPKSTQFGEWLITNGFSTEINGNPVISFDNLYKGNELYDIIEQELVMKNALTLLKGTYGIDVQFISNRSSGLSGNYVY